MACVHQSLTTSRKSLVNLKLNSMDQIREIRSIVDEETRQMIAHEILIAALAVYLCREAVGVATALGSSVGSYDDGEACECFAGSARLQPACLCEV